MMATPTPNFLPCAKAHTKAQASMELLTLMGFALIFFIPLALLFFATSQNSTDEAAIAQARLAGRQLADNAGEVYLQGAPARRGVMVNFPASLQDVRINGSEIVFSLSTSKGRLDIVTSSFANLTDGTPSLSSMQNPNTLRISQGSRLIILQARLLASKNTVVEIFHG